MATAITTPDLEPAPTYAERRGHLLPYAVITPSLLIIGGILAFPLGWLVWLSFQHYGLRELIQQQGEWVGLKNYQAILTDPFFHQVLIRTLLFTVACVGLTIALSTLIALLLTRVRRVVRVIVMSALVFVWATPVIVTCLSTIWDFGVFNQIYVLLNERPSADYFTIAIYSYRESFGVTQYGLGAAIAVVLVIVLVIVTFFYVRETVKAAEIA